MARSTRGRRASHPRGIPSGPPQVLMILEQLRSQLPALRIQLLPLVKAVTFGDFPDCRPRHPARSFSSALVWRFHGSRLARIWVSLITISARGRDFGDLLDARENDGGDLAGPFITPAEEDARR